MTGIITIDGPSGSGKGTICQLVADALGWHLLDSGALYRLVGMAADKAGVDFADHGAVADVAINLDVSFQPRPGLDPLISLSSEDVSLKVRLEESGALASQVAAIPAVRTALMARQKAFAKEPGLVADGRDMGTVVFPEAGLKIFLTASAEERARRRYKQLKDKGESVSLAQLLADIQARDERDQSRSVSPLVPADDAIVLDSTELSIEAVTKIVLDEARTRGLAPQA